ncbi:hypothetical protein LTR09_002516 [Extremus antarcticus]|uniref:Ubiquitin-like modifier HUB1 n=1 Tax=Extremus antarcticus TaxID=702011 RepID=A0AAJ0LV58_9PEZI|nr:hypothetical protein LTR09_002516 [Extremus antarcticus]
MSDRSASPVRDDEQPRPKKQKTGGFKFKDKKPKDENAADSKDSGRLERGYRDRSPRRDRNRDRPADDKPSSETPQKATESRKSETKPSADISSKFPTDTTSTPTTAPDTSTPKPKKEKKKKAVPISNEPMIIVNINDRLGTKAAIPCLASDSIKAFKAIVAAHIGRQPHEIMLKRQGERPFKDQLTLADYGEGATSEA